MYYCILGIEELQKLNPPFIRPLYRNGRGQEQICSMCEYLDSEQTAFPRIPGTGTALWWGLIPQNHTLPKGSILPYYACNLRRCQIISGYNKHLVHFLQIPNLCLISHMSYLCCLGLYRYKPMKNEIPVPHAHYKLLYS